VGNKKLYTDFACLSPSNFEDLQKNKLPTNALYELTEKIKPFDETITTDDLRSELLNFSKNWNSLKKSFVLRFAAILHYTGHTTFWLTISYKFTLFCNYIQSLY